MIRENTYTTCGALPLHETPLHKPLPAVPERRPAPTALLSPWLTVTVRPPFGATLPLTLINISPALTRMPLAIRIGYR